MKVYLHDEAPALGCGWRTVVVRSKGWKWVRLRNPATGRVARLKRATWDRIERHAQKTLQPIKGISLF